MKSCTAFHPHPLLLVAAHVYIARDTEAEEWEAEQQQQQADARGGGGGEAGMASALRGVQLHDNGGTGDNGGAGNGSLAGPSGGWVAGRVDEWRVWCVQGGQGRCDCDLVCEGEEAGPPRYPLLSCAAGADRHPLSHLCPANLPANLQASHRGRPPPPCWWWTAGCASGCQWRRWPASCACACAWLKPLRPECGTLTHRCRRPWNRRWQLRRSCLSGRVRAEAGAQYCWAPPSALQAAAATLAVGLVAAGADEAATAALLAAAAAGGGTAIPVVPLTPCPAGDRSRLSRQPVVDTSKAGVGSRTAALYTSRRPSDRLGGGLVTAAAAAATSSSRRKAATRHTQLRCRA